MSKLIIEQALKQAIAANNLHQIALTGGNENLFTRPMVNFIPNCYAQVRTYRPPAFGGYRGIDLVKFHYEQPRERPVIQEANTPDIDWALEAKHFTPYQKKELNRFNPRRYLGYLEYSLSGPIEDALKLVDCGFEKFYILQLQTYITGFNLLTCTYTQLVKKYPLFHKYLRATKEASARTKINDIVTQNWIVELERYSRQLLDTNLICGHIPKTISTVEANVDVTLHYLISGPFYYKDLYPRLINKTNKFPLDPTKPFEKQVGLKNPIPAWDIDISIASNPRA